MQGQWVHGQRTSLSTGSWLTQLANSLRLGAKWQRWRVKATVSGDPYSLHLDGGTAYIAFRGRIERKTVLGLQQRLAQFGPAVRATDLDVAGIEGLDARGLAMLAMLCSGLERDGRRPRLSGVPQKLYLAAIEARIHHLVNFG